MMLWGSFCLLLFLCIVQNADGFQRPSLRSASSLNRSYICGQQSQSPINKIDILNDDSVVNINVLADAKVNTDLSITTPSSSVNLSKLIPKLTIFAASLIPLVFGVQSVMATGFADDIVEKANSSGFIQAFLLIFISEIGDKTFFIAGLLAAKYSRVVAFVGSIGALAVMTIISTLIGQIFHNIPSSIAQGIPFDDYVAVLAFTYFGVKTLYDAAMLPDGDSSGIEEEKKEAEEVVEEITSEQLRRSAIAAIIQTFSLVFAAEIGDRSFLSTIALSAALNPFAVALGAILAHASATGIAVAGGALMSEYLSEKTIGYIGGSFFIIFALTTAFNVF